MSSTDFILGQVDVESQEALLDAIREDYEKGPRGVEGAEELLVRLTGLISNLELLKDLGSLEDCRVLDMARVLRNATRSTLMVLRKP